MPRLVELDAYFLKHYKGIADKHLGKTLPDGTTQWGGFETEFLDHVDRLEDAHSIMFGCPKCFAANGNSMVRTHMVLVSFEGRGLPDESGSHNIEGKPSRWKVSGTGMNDLVCTPSVLIGGSCAWHGFIGSSGVAPGHAA